MRDLILIINGSAVSMLIVTALFGLIIGSFLNVVIHRIPKMMEREWANILAEENKQPMPYTDHFNLMIPPSTCPQCGHRITAIENVPLLSYLFLGGKCRACKRVIPLRIPLIELATAILSALLIWHLGFNSRGLSSLLCLYLLIALAFIDIDTQLLPDSLTYLLLWCGLLVNLTGIFVPLQSAVLGAVVGYLFLLGIYWSFKLVTGKEGMGYGDFKLVAALGAWFGCPMLLAIVIFASLIGIAVGTIRLIIFKNDSHFPFGPCLVVAGMTALFFSAELIPLLNYYF